MTISHGSELVQEGGQFPVHQEQVEQQLWKVCGRAAQRKNNSEEQQLRVPTEHERHQAEHGGQEAHSQPNLHSKLFLAAQNDGQ